MTSGAPALSALGALVRRHDPDRFLTALFAPPERRETLFLLYAFNHELARAREVASQPMLALIRLHWWREVVEGARRRHEVAGPLGAALDAGLLDAGALGAMIDAREAETEAIASLDAWRAYIGGTAGALAGAAGRVLGADQGQRGRLMALGAAYGVAGVLRSIVPLARQGQCRLPEDLLGAHGLTPDGFIAAARGGEVPAPLRAAVAAEGMHWLARGEGRFPRAVVPAGLVGALARRDLRRAGSGGPAAGLPTGPRGLGDRLAVMLAARRGRV